MAYLHKIDAAIALGVNIELIDYFIKVCPKPGEKRKLKTQKLLTEKLFDEDELKNFGRYLNEPWPKPKSGKRPNIPVAIQRDIRVESHHSCAICGHMDNCEIAHIEQVSNTYNNGPDNLILLCPNHHSKYDYGYIPASNVTIEEIRAAKMLKRNARRRMLKLESNVTTALLSLLKLVQDLEGKVKNCDGDVMNQIYTTEAKNLIGMVPDLIDNARKSASSDRVNIEVEKIIAEKIPTLQKLSLQMEKTSDIDEISVILSDVSEETSEMFIEINEVLCPRCEGSGLVGLVGDLCKFCKGSCFVTREKSAQFDSILLDENECPRCNGSGQTGKIGDLCRYCGGSCFVSSVEVRNYDERKFDEIGCPRCGGSGQTGLVGDLCKYCGGSCVVSKKKAEDYDENEIDEVDCPRCNGSGKSGKVGDLCKYCGGSCVVSKRKAEDYDESKIDEVDCPRCCGRGQIGLVGDFCSYCGGSCVVSKKKFGDYDKNDIDEIECPRCGGRGQTGRVGDVCALCNGSCFISKEVNKRYKGFRAE